MKSENEGLILENQKLNDFSERLQNEVKDLRKTTTFEINLLKEKLTVKTPKLEKMDRLISENKNLNDNYEKLRTIHNKKAFEMMTMECRKNNQIDDLRIEISELKK